MTLAHAYAEALFRAVKEHPEEHDVFVSRLVGVLGAGGRERLLPRIASEYKRLAEKRACLEETVLACAHKDGEKDSRILADLALLGGEKPRVVYDKTLVGGYILSVRGVRLDRSHARVLRTMYRHIIT
jgi:F0F1-type ATP synthase delta subunit